MAGRLPLFHVAGGAGGNVGKSSANFANDGCIVFEVGEFTGGGGSINGMMGASDVEGETLLTE